MARQINPAPTPRINGFFTISLTTNLNGFSVFSSTNKDKEITAKTLKSGTIKAEIMAAASKPSEPKMFIAKGIPIIAKLER